MSEDSSRLEDIIIRNMDKLDSKLDKVEDKVSCIQRKIDVVEERQGSKIRNYEKQAELIESLHESVSSHIKRDELFQQSINDKLHDYNTLLDIHIQGVQTLKELHAQNAEKIELYKKEHEKRIEKLEEPVKAKAWLYSKYTKIAGFITVLAGIIGSVTKITGLW